MASVGTSSADFLFGDDFDAIFDALDDDEEFVDSLEAAVEEVQNEGGISCEFCSKICKSKQGLSRHVGAKHKEKATKVQKKEPALKYNVFADLFKDTTQTIVQRDVFDKSLKEEIKDYRLQLEESSLEFKTIRSIYDSFSCKGNSEAFYAKFYGEIALNSSKYFQGLSQRAATLFATKLADTLLGHAKSEMKKNATKDAVPTNSLSENEQAGMQYLGGYVLHSLYKKHRTSIHHNTPESQQAISILTACRLSREKEENSQVLINFLNRGGLWSPTTQAQAIFKRTEHHFRQHTIEARQSIDHEHIVMVSVKDPQVTSSYDAILSDAELEICNSIGKDILNSIVILYVKVRSFSYAKDIVQKYKIKQKQCKAKALRKQLERSSQEDRQM